MFLFLFFVVVDDFTFNLKKSCPIKKKKFSWQFLVPYELLNQQMHSFQEVLLIQRFRWYSVD